MAYGAKQPERKLITVGLARDLSMGPHRPRGQRDAGNTDLAALRRLTAAPRPDLETFAAVLNRVAGRAGSMTTTEGSVYLAASRRYEGLSADLDKIQKQVDREEAAVIGREVDRRAARRAETAGHR
jgi:hypothetical protein